jgi:flavin reductase (DIM6/NTAB) family NADH-FMN oxidoreductase RutF
MAATDDCPDHAKSPGSDPAGELSLAFTGAMGRLASGIVMVTAEVDGKPWGLTISACCSVSTQPPTVLVSLGEHTVSAKVIGETGRFGVSVLGERSLEAAKFGSAPGAPKFVDAFCDTNRTRVGASRTPVVDGALAHVDCEVVNSVNVADHQVFFGAARSVLLSVEDAPLLYYARGYRVLSAVPAGERPTSSELFYING